MVNSLDYNKISNIDHINNIKKFIFLKIFLLGLKNAHTCVFIDQIKMKKRDFFKENKL